MASVEKKVSCTWDFTINNPTDDDIRFVMTLECNKICVAEERAPDTGTKHLQGRVTFKRAYRLSGLKKLNHRAHWEATKASEDFNYCRKADCTVIRDEDTTRQGRRTDIEKKIDEIKNGTFDKFCPEYVKYHAGFDKLIDLVKEEKNMKEFIEQTLDEVKELNDYQKLIMERVNRQNNRQITWVANPGGNIGKSTLANYLKATGESVAVFENAGSAHLAHAYDGEKLIIFDLSKECNERVNYDVIERFKNGRIFSSKYDSGTKWFPKPKVLVFANWEPDYNAWIKDRYDVIKI